MNTKVTARARITYRILCITLQITFAYQKHCHGMGQRTLNLLCCNWINLYKIRGLQGPHTKTFRTVINTGEATERQINERWLIVGPPRG